MYIVASMDASTVALADFCSHRGVGYNLYAALVQAALPITYFIRRT